MTKTDVRGGLGEAEEDRQIGRPLCGCGGEGLLKKACILSVAAVTLPSQWRRNEV